MQEIILFDNDYGSAVSVVPLKNGTEFYCTGNPLAVLDKVKDSNNITIVVNDNFNNVDVLQLSNNLHSLTSTLNARMFLYTHKREEFYKRVILSHGYNSVIYKPLSLAQIYLSVTSYAPLDENVKLPIGHAQKYAKHYFALQQPLPSFDSVPSFDYFIVKSAIQILKRDHAVTPTMECLVQELNICESRLRKSFHNIYHTSIHMWLREEKLLIAKQLVANGFGSITDVAYQLGFADVAHFSRTFKKRYGCAPSRFFKKTG